MTSLFRTLAVLLIAVFAGLPISAAQAQFSDLTKVNPKTGAGALSGGNVITNPAGPPTNDEPKHGTSSVTIVGGGGAAAPFEFEFWSDSSDIYAYGVFAYENITDPRNPPYLWPDDFSKGNGQIQFWSEDRIKRDDRYGKYYIVLFTASSGFGCMQPDGAAGPCPVNRLMMRVPAPTP